MTEKKEPQVISWAVDLIKPLRDDSGLCWADAYTMSRRRIGIAISKETSMLDIISSIASWEVNLIGRIGYGDTRFSQQVQDEKGKFGAFLINIYYGTIAVMEGTIHNNHDLIYTVARKGDLFEARFLTKEICQSGARGDISGHHRFGLKGIEKGVLNYIESIRTQFDDSIKSDFGTRSRATKIEDFERNANIADLDEKSVRGEINKLQGFRT